MWLVTSHYSACTTSRRFLKLFPCTSLLFGQSVSEKKQKLFVFSPKHILFLARGQSGVIVTQQIVRLNEILCLVSDASGQRDFLFALCSVLVCFHSRPQGSRGSDWLKEFLSLRSITAWRSKCARSHFKAYRFFFSSLTRHGCFRFQPP